MTRGSYKLLLAVALCVLSTLELVAEKDLLGARQALFGSAAVSLGGYASSPAWMTTLVVLLGLSVLGLKILPRGDAVFNLAWVLWFLIGFMTRLPYHWFLMGLLLVVLGGAGLRRRLNEGAGAETGAGAA